MDYTQPTEEYVPKYNEQLVKQFLSHYDKAPGTFTPEFIAQVKEDAAYYGLHHHEGMESDITVGGIIKQAGAGFVTGFTTFNIGDEPENVGERIARNVGNLAGFVGYIPALPTKAGVLAKAANAIRGKSLPMFVSGKVTEAVRGVASDVTRKAISGRAGAFKSMSEFLQQGGVKNTLEGAFHLGVASSVSSWQGGVDEMMHAFVGGAQTGAAFRLIGNYLRVPGAGIPKHGAKFGDMNEAQQAEVALKTIASSLFTGLPATLRGETAPEQIYEYLLGAYFGVRETPHEQRTRDKQLVKLFRQGAKENPQKLAELSPGWDKLSPREQKLVIEARDQTFNEAGDIIAAKAMEYVGESLHLPEFREDAGRKRTEMPEAKSDLQLQARESLLLGKEVTPEAWKSMSKEDKIFYAKAIDAVELTGQYDFYEIESWTKAERNTMADLYKIKNWDKMGEAELSAEIMFAQSKRADGFFNVVKDANTTDDVVVTQQDVGEAISGSPVNRRSVQFARDFLADNLVSVGSAKKNEYIAARAKEIEKKVSDLLESDTPDSRAFMEWATKKYGKQDDPFPDEAHSLMRQWFKLADPVNVKQVPFISPRIVVTETAEGTQRSLHLDRLATDGTPVDAMGNKKLMRFPKNRMDAVWDLIGEKNTDAYSVVDQILISENGMRALNLYRY